MNDEESEEAQGMTECYIIVAIETLVCKHTRDLKMRAIGEHPLVESERHPLYPSFPITNLKTIFDPLGWACESFSKKWGPSKTDDFAVGRTKMLSKWRCPQ